MSNLIAFVQDLASAALALAFGSKVPEEALQADVTQSTQEQFGHYQCNSALKIGKMLGLPPRQVAEAIVSLFDRESAIEKLEIAGPGFHQHHPLLPLYLATGSKRSSTAIDSGFRC